MLDDANLVSCAGLVPVMALAEQTGLPDVLDEGGGAPSTSGILLREGAHGHTRQLSTVDRARWLAIVPPTSASGTPTLLQSAGMTVRLM